MSKLAADDFINDCFIAGDEICRYEISSSNKYEIRVNSMATELIAFSKKSDQKILP